jgi:ELWxxDGT repeat protein
LPSSPSSLLLLLKNSNIVFSFAALEPYNPKRKTSHLIFFFLCIFYLESKQASKNRTMQMLKRVLLTNKQQSPLLLLLLLLLLLFAALPISSSSSSSNLINNNGGEKTGGADSTPVAVDDSNQAAAQAADVSSQQQLLTLGSDPEYLVAWNNHVVFAADDGIHGKELWIILATTNTNGDGSGSRDAARLLADIRPGFSPSNPSHLVAFPNSFDAAAAAAGSTAAGAAGGGVYFAADNGQQGNELYKTDGTSLGTVLWADMNPGPSSSDPSNFAVIPPVSANNVSTTTTTTTTGDGPTAAATGASLFFAANDGLKGNEPWIILPGGGTTPKLLRDISPDGSSNPGGPPIWFRNALYFAADNIANGQELWRTTGHADTDTSTGSTELWSDIRSSHGSSNPSDFYVFRDQLYFCARGGTGIAGNGDAGRELYVNNGTRLGTKLVSDINQQMPSSSSLSSVGGGGSSSSSSSISGASAAGAAGEGSSSRPSDFCEFQDLLFFAANDGVHGRELFVTDGTETGTRLFADIRSGPASSNPTGLIVFDNKLYFAANDGISGTELWVVQNARPDNANDDAKLFADIFPGPASSNPAWFVVAHPPPVTVVAAAAGEEEQQQQPAGIMMFAANDGVNGRELWAVTSEANVDQPAKAMLWTDINKRVPSSRSNADAMMAPLSSWQSRIRFVATSCMLLGALMSVF